MFPRRREPLNKWATYLTGERSKVVSIRLEVQPDSWHRLIEFLTLGIRPATD